MALFKRWEELSGKVSPDDSLIPEALNQSDISMPLGEIVEIFFGY
jgi:hypothetical protein